MATIVDFIDLKNMLGLENTSFTSYPDLQLIADSVHDALESYCGRTLNPITKVTETGYFTSQSQFIDLKTLPITSVISVTVINNFDIEVNPIELTTQEYRIKDYGLKLIRNYIDADYTVVYKGGFKTIPLQLYRAELSQIVYEYQNKNNIGTTNFSNAGGTTSSPGFVLLPEVKRLADPFIHPNKVGF